MLRIFTVCQAITSIYRYWVFSDNAQPLSLTNDQVMRNNAHMSKMRKILGKLMESAGHTAYDIQEKTGVQTSTIYRYLASDRSDLKPTTVKKIAALYGLTESQLRGDVPIDGMEIPAEREELRELLPPDDYTFMSNVRRLRPEARAILHSFAEMLVAEPSADYQNEPAERRERDVYPNPGKRVGESRYKSSIKKRRTPLEIRTYLKHSNSA